MSTATEYSLDELADLDFDPACEVSVVDNTGAWTPCGKTADWLVVSVHHCKPDTTSQMFLCDAHMANIVGGRRFTCGTCEAQFPVLPRLIRTERIR